MKQTRWTTIAVLTIAFLVLSVSGLQAKEKEIRIGAPLCMSGMGAPWGIPISRAMQWEVDQVNAKGGLQVGKEIYKVKLIIEDTKFTPAGAASAAKKLINRDKVQFMCGGITGFEALSIRPITEAAKMFLGVCSYPEETIGPNYPFTFRYPPVAPEVPAIIYPWAQKQYPHVNRLAQINGNDESGLTSKKFTARYMEQVGIEIVAAEVFELDTKNFRPLLIKILATKPDAIDTGSMAPTTMGLICKQARELGFKGPFWSPEVMTAQPIVEAAGADAAEGVFGWGCASQGPFATDMAKEFRAYYEKKYGTWDGVSLAADMSIGILMQAIEASGSLDMDTVVKKLESGITFNTFFGKTVYGRKDYYGIPHQAVFDVVILQIKNGKAEVVRKVTMEQQLESYKKLGWKAPWMK